MSLPQAIKTMLQDVVGVADNDITYGTRNQFGSYPAIFFTIDDNVTLCIGASPLKRASVSISSVAQTAEDAQGIAELVQAQLDAGTYNSIVFQAIAKKNSVLQESSFGSGEETNPFICVTTCDIFYKE